MNKIYGLVYHSPLIIHHLIPPKDYTRVLLISDNASDVRRDIDSAVKLGRKKPLVVLAGSLSILQLFLHEFNAGKIESPVKVILFDFPGLLIPFDTPCVKWLDSDYQSGGAWQITKFRPETFLDLLSALKPLEKKTIEELLKMNRHVAKECVSEIEKIAKFLPETYKDLLPPEEVKNTQKQTKQKAKKANPPKVKL
jgi:hypothetical protein